MTARPAATWMLRCWTLFAASSASISTTPNIFFQHRFGLLSAQRAYAKAPYKTDWLWETLRARDRPGRTRTGYWSPLLMTCPVSMLSRKTCTETTQMMMW
jgi:hypothetical protein